MRSDLKRAMTATDQIITMALKQKGLFTRKDILNLIQSGKKTMSAGSLAVILNRMLADNKIIRVSHGIYRLNDNLKYNFSYTPNDFMLSLNKHIKEKFPFIAYCIWQPSILVSMMQHVPAVKITLIDVEREVMESVFMSMQGMESKILILLNPSKEEAERYITNKEVIIIRPLIKEAPIDIIDGCPVPTLEKMLVDAISDKELHHLQGNELYTIYSNALCDYEVKKAKLLRYAARRNRKNKVEQILKTINDTF